MSDDEQPNYTQLVEDATPNTRGFLDRIGFPKKGVWLYLLTAALIIAQCSAFLLANAPIPGMTITGWSSGLWIGFYTLPLLLLTIATAGALRRTCQYVSGTWDMLGIGGVLVIMSAAVAGFGKVGSLNSGSSIWLTIWTVTTSFSLKPALDRLLDLAQPRSS